MTTVKNSSRYVYIEAMRILATFFVIFNHTSNYGFMLFTQRQPGSIQFWAYLLVSIFCKFSVFLFFAISGAIMLARPDEPLPSLWKNRILKIAVSLFVFSLLQFILLGKTDIKTFFVQLYSSKTMAHLWYLYAFLAYLISLPFLRSLVKNLETKYFYYLIGIVLLYCGCLPIAEYLIAHGEYSLNSDLRLSWLTANIVAYPCIGYFLEHRINIKNCKKALPLLWVASLIGICISAYMTYYKGQITGIYQLGKSETFHSSFVVFLCIAIYLTIKYCMADIKLPPNLEKLILSMGKCTFGIYLLHPIILNTAPYNTPVKTLLSKLTELNMNPMIACFIVCFGIMMVCYAATWILRKIPLFRYILGG